ncbi:MAG: hypothetical protein IRZ16_07925 [Myxococcaceae bacterium]|nr:hypothetical protein [Myxococcaceae bacterium]
MTSAALPLTVTPAAGTPSGSAPFAGQSFSFTGLPGDTVFTASVAAGAVADAFGNVNETGASVKFHTRPAQPQTGTVLTLRNDVVAFDVASDPDGVVTLVMETTATSKPMLFTWFDGVTGALSSGVLGNRPSGDLVALSTAAWSNAHADLSSHRARGYREAYSAQTFVGGVNDGTLLPAAPGDVLFVPVGPGCADDPGAPEVGVITGAGAFVRGSVVEPVQVTPFQLLIESPNDWELVSVAGGTLVAQARTCSCGASASCAWQPARSVPLPFGYTVAATPRLSVAGTATGERRLYVADTTAGLRVEICEAQCTSTPCPSNGARLTLASEGLFVASANSGNEVIGAQKKAAGVQLVWRDLQASCTGDWSVLGIVPGSSGSSVTDWRPAMFGDRHGVLWLDGTTLKLYIP